MGRDEFSSLAPYTTLEAHLMFDSEVGNLAYDVDSQALAMLFEQAGTVEIAEGNLPWDVDNGRLEQVFSEYGKVVEARVVYDRETVRSRGFRFVTMSNKTELNDAIAALDGQNMEVELSE
ncbi:unnamed protein product [Brassica napus]|uniref:(rape) hypothetical protein n=1 Tax=Brassica napus TaxID=3708 RepID=A0A817BDB8_BRANA|nr:unnamed protein product [Brassica napus]